jgi:hypothetical protein
MDKESMEALADQMGIEVALRIYVLHVRDVGLVCKAEGALSDHVKREDVADCLRAMADKIETELPTNPPMHTAN